MKEILNILLILISALSYSQNNSESDVFKKIIDHEVEKGTLGIYIQCEKAKMSSCYEQASKACGSAGYQVLEDMTTINTESTGIPVVFSSFTNATTKEYRSMLIQCK